MERLFLGEGCGLAWVRSTRMAYESRARVTDRARLICIKTNPVDRLPSLQPSIRCNTITTATIIGGTDRGPASVNKSANISSGNNRPHFRCNNPSIKCSAIRGWQKAVVERNRSAWFGVSPNVTHQFSRRHQPAPWTATPRKTPAT